MELCYVDSIDDFGDILMVYFTNNPKQWGDDWNDKPYEHNAGEPYTEDRYDIKKFIIEGNLKTPSLEYNNSPYSVEDINNGCIGWLRGDKSELMAGADIEEFYKFCRENKINVYGIINIEK